MLPDDLDSREKADVAMMMILTRVGARLKFERGCVLKPGHKAEDYKPY